MRIAQRPSRIVKLRLCCIRIGRNSNQPCLVEDWSGEPITVASNWRLAVDYGFGAAFSAAFSHGDAGGCREAREDGSLPGQKAAPLRKSTPPASDLFAAWAPPDALLSTIVERSAKSPATVLKPTTRRCPLRQPSFIAGLSLPNGPILASKVSERSGVSRRVRTLLSGLMGERQLNRAVLR